MGKRKKKTRYCENCRHFAAEYIDGYEDRESWCHRYPPTYIGPTWQELRDMDDVPNDTSYWQQPTVAIHATCGEWEAR